MYFRVLFACLAAVMALCLVSGAAVDNSQTTVRDITVVKDLRDFAKKHPGLQTVRLTKETTNTRDQSVRYTMGGRVSGDRVVAQGADVYSYPAKKDVTIQLSYPQSGTGSIVTYVDLLVTADTTDGNAYVVAGGIGMRFISIVVEANQTENFSYTAKLYGTN